MDGRLWNSALWPAGQVSITSLLSAGQEQCLLKAFKYCPLSPLLGHSRPHPTSQRVDVAGRELLANRVWHCSLWAGQGKQGQAVLIFWEFLILFTFWFIKNCQWCFVLISQSKLAMPYNHFIKGQQAKFLRYWLKKKMEFMSVSVNFSFPNWRNEWTGTWSFRIMNIYFVLRAGTWMRQPGMRRLSMKSSGVSRMSPEGAPVSLHGASILVLAVPSEEPRILSLLLLSR